MQKTKKINRTIERRKHPRYKTKNVAFAILKAEREEELGQIINISKGGLSFQYFIGNREFQMAQKLDVLLAENGIQVENIEYRVVDDSELVNEIPFSSITKREQRVFFSGLTDSQQQGLDNFIERHTYQEEAPASENML